VKYRYCCPNKKISGYLNTYSGPFIGAKTHHIEDEQDTDQETLMPSGLEWYIELLRRIYEPTISRLIIKYNYCGEFMSRLYRD
jgi:hypothetical protein